MEDIRAYIAKRLVKPTPEAIDRWLLNASKFFNDKPKKLVGKIKPMPKP